MAVVCWRNAATGTWDDEIVEETEDEVDVVKEVEDWAEEEGERRAVIEAVAVAVDEWGRVEESSEEDRRDSFIESSSLVCMFKVDVEQEVRRVPLVECADMAKSPR